MAQEIYAAIFNGSAWVAAGANATTGGGVSNSGDSATQPRLAAGGGQLQLAWKSDRITGQTGLTSDIYARRWNGTSFVEDVLGDASYSGVSQNATSATTPALTVDPTGRAFVAWDDISGGNPSVRRPRQYLRDKHGLLR